MKTLAVALSTYNGERYLADFLDSIATQERLPDELVVCDDGSSDRTVGLIEGFAARAPFPVRLSVNDRNLGVTKNKEHTVALCDAELIALCDQDDIWYPKKLLACSEAFERDHEIGYAFSDAELMDGGGHPLDGRLWEAQGFFASRRAAAAEGRLLPLLVVYTLITGATMVFRSDLRSYLLPVPHGWHHDAWIALLASFVRPYRLIDEPLMRYRVHDEQQIGVPPSVMPDDVGWQKWRVRLAQAPEKVNLRKADLHRQRRRTQAMLYDEAAARIESGGPAYVSEFGGALQPSAAESLEDIKERARHLRVRGTLPDGRMRRLSRISQELRSGRYGRYSAGALSALQDLVS